MDTKTSLVELEDSTDSFAHKYRLVVVLKPDSREIYGIASQDDIHHNALCVIEISSDKELVLSIVDTLNKHRVPSVHVLDVISDLMNWQY